VKKLREATEDEMVAAFLRAEIDSPRWRDRILSLVAKGDLTEQILRDPDVTDSVQNWRRFRTSGRVPRMEQEQIPVQRLARRSCMVARQDL